MNADLDNPEVEYAAMPNNTEHREMIDLDVQLHEENEVEFVEDNDGEDEEEIFRAFCQWLQTADGGRRDRKMAKQHSSQVCKILAIIDPEKSLSSLFNKNLIWDKFLVDYPFHSQECHMALWHDRHVFPRVPYGTLKMHLY